MSWIILFLSVSCFSTLTNGQQQSDPPKIFNFLTKDLVAPEDVKFGRKNALTLPCGASGNNLQWTWRHNDNITISNGDKFTVGEDGTLYGSYLESEQSGHYQCFVRDNATGIETFSRKIKVAVTVVGEFNDTEPKQVEQSVDLGDEFSYACPQHAPSYGVSYSWVGKSAGSDIQFKRNERRAITQSGHLFIMFVTEDDFTDLEGYVNQGISCKISGANRFDESGLLKLKKKNPDKKDPETPRAPSWKLEFMSAAKEEALEGKNKTFYCLAAGRPEPKITWKINTDGKWENLVNEKDKFEIADAFHGRLLNIISVKHKIHDQTKYRCEAENSQNVGNQTVYDMQLKVKVPPKWTAEPPPELLTIDVNGNGSLTCDVFADPSPSFIWYKNGRNLTKSTAHVRPNGNKLDFQNVSSQQDSGVYQCVAENPHGIIVSYTAVRVRAMAPSFETGFGPFYLFNGTEGRLTCNPEAAPRPSEYKWYKGTTLLTSSPPYRIEHGEFSTLIIDKVDENRDKGSYKCYAENSLGNATETATATVLERTIITVRPRNKEVQEGTRVDLSCKAKADPSLETELRYKWKKNKSDIEYNNRIQWLEEAKVLTIANIKAEEAGNYTCVAYTPDPKRSEDQASAVIDIVPGIPDVIVGEAPIYKTVWFIALVIVIALLFIVLLIFELYTRHDAAKYPVEKREKKRGAFIEKEPLDDEKGAVTSAGRPEIPPPYQSKGSPQKSPKSDRDSLDEYEPKFQRNGTYGNKTKNAPEKTDNAVFDTYV